MSAIARVSFFMKLGVAYVFFYRLPRAIEALLVRLPRGVVGLLYGAVAALTGRRAAGVAEEEEGGVVVKVTIAADDDGPAGVAAVLHNAADERSVELVYNPNDSAAAAAFGLIGDGSHEGAAAAPSSSFAPPPYRSGSGGGRPSLHYAGPLYSGHIHTIFNGLRPVWHRFAYRRHRLESFDGQHLNLDVLLPSMLRAPPSGGGSGAGSPVVPAETYTAPAAGAAAPVRGLIFIIPGLLNASTTNYVRNFSYQAASRDFAVAVLNYRGMGSTPLEVPRLFSATFTDDIRHVLEKHLSPAQVRELVYGATAAAAAAADGGSSSERIPADPIPIIGVGFSLGGVILVKYISEEGQRSKRQGGGGGGRASPPCRLDAAIAVTSPFDLVASDAASRSWSYRTLYEAPFAVGFRKFVRHNRDMIEKLPNVDGAKLFHGEERVVEETDTASGKVVRRTQRTAPLITTMTSIRVFDELINASHNGYDSPVEYYAAANSIPWLAHCQTPCICISNRGDPVCGPAIPSREWQRVIARNGNVSYVCFPVGGHLGFLGSPLQEVGGGPNLMEEFVLRCCSSFAEQEARNKMKAK